MQPFRALALKSLVAASCLIATASSHASLVFVGLAPQTGTGVGAAATVLTLQSQNESTKESGGVSFGAAGNVISGPDASTGASLTTTRALSEVGARHASDLRIIFNPVEPGTTFGGANGITLNDLRLSIYSPTGAILFNSGAFAPQTFDTTFNGVGQAGYAFKLDDTQAAAAEAAAFGAGFADNRVGLSASASDATGGAETFLLQADATVLSGRESDGEGAGHAIAEPATLALLGLGLVSVLMAGRGRST